MRPDFKESIKGAVHEAAARLSSTGTETPWLDAEVLAAFVLGWDRAHLLAHWDEPAPSGFGERFERLVERRAQGEPVAYIRHRKDFLGLELYVDSRVLIPRPETELLVTLAVQWLSAHQGAKAVDVGTGSGAVALGMCSQVSGASVTATDVSADALAVARLNAHRAGLSVEFRLGSLLEPIEGQVDLIAANLPYLDNWEYEALRGTSIGFEPRLALTDGADGLTLFRELFRQIPAKLRAGGCVLLEIGGARQVEELRSLVEDFLPGFDQLVHADYAGLPRVLQLEKRPRTS